MTTIPTADVEDFSAEGAFFDLLKTKDAKTPSEDTEETNEDTSDEPVEDDEPETSEETPEEDESSEDETGDEEDEEASEDEDEPKKKDEKKAKVVLEPDADAVIKHKVDGKEIEIPVKDLTRLYGQEASLTRKSQELASQRKMADEATQRHALGLDTLLTRAKEAYAPYEKLNFFALAKDPTISAEDLNVLQSQARAAYDNVAFLQTELDTALRAHNETRQNSLREQAQVAWNYLADPKTGIENWSEPLYDDIRTYAMSNGIAKEVINELVDPAALKLLHKAMLFDKGQKALTQTVKKTAKSPKKIIKGGAETTGKTKSNTKSDATAMSNLKRSGSMDDAMDVFIARMTKD